MALRIPLGISEFRRLREERLTFIDKSSLIRDVIDDTNQVILLPRPRRFGKTLNLSMLRAFFEKAPGSLWPLFEGLLIATEGTDCRAHFQRYPTIALTFKDAKARSWDKCRAKMASIIATAFGEHRYLLASGALTPEEAAAFQSILGEGAGDVQLWGALALLSALLQRHHGEQVLVLIDEYDTPIHAAFSGGYYEEAIEFFRNFLSGGLKDNRALWRGVLTGILRVAKDSVFTGLNNLDVFTILRPEYSQHFGFTEPEVEALVREAGQEARLGDIQRWYNGYVFGGRVMYNPWSVLAFLKSADKQFRPYWVETSSNDLVQDLLVRQGLGFREDLERLIRGETIERGVAEQVALREVREREALVWSLLLMMGYLKAVSVRWEEGGARCSLAVPNLEVQLIYRDLFLSWADRGLGGDRRREEFVRALLRGDADTVERLLQRWFQSSVSTYDTAGFDPPERFYHGFVLGLLVSLSATHEVRSNEESGYGRCDVVVAPRQEGQAGVVLELKVVEGDRGETADQAIGRAFTQRDERAYAAGLRARGAQPVHELALVFAGKRVHARSR